MDGPSNDDTILHPPTHPPTQYTQAAAIPPDQNRPGPAALDALATYLISKKGEIEKYNPSGGYAIYKLWSRAAKREQTLAEAVQKVVAAHGRLRVKLAAGSKKQGKGGQ
jgi:hypothetical protein